MNKQICKRYSTTILVFVILSVAILSINSKNKTETKFLKMFGYKGKVKSICTYILDPNCDLSNIKTGDTIKSVDMHFDRKGRLLKSISLNEKNNPLLSVTYLYDKKNNPTEMITHTESGSLKERLVLYYDKGGHTIGEKLYNSSGGLEMHLKDIHDNNGNLIETYSALDNYLYPRYIYDYNEDNKLVEERSYFAFNKYYKSIYKYDDFENVIEALRYDTDGTIDTGYKATYYKEAMPKMKVRFKNDSITEKIYYEYDNKDRILIETHFNSDGSFDYQITAIYDNYNNLVMEKFIGRYTGTQENILTFDEIGNVILEIRKWNTQIEFIEKSSIIYY
ncbi:MAG: hypothetical protein HQ521_17325 [Bacteroidetes bacterium]|nr:hypothetical protein [Bacteroidota bacterium]